MLPVDLSQLPPAVRLEMERIFRRDFDAGLITALEEQKRAAAFYAANQPRAINGIGEHRMSVHPFFRNMHRLSRGHDCWQDEEWVRYFLKHSPECAVRSGGTKIQVGYTGVAGNGKRCATWNAEGKREPQINADERG